jgi:hypothetical protein
MGLLVLLGPKTLLLTHFLVALGVGSIASQDRDGL